MDYLGEWGGHKNHRSINSYFDQGKRAAHHCMRGGGETYQKQQTWHAASQKRMSIQIQAKSLTAVTVTEESKLSDK
jgi:hypothetical protein